MLLSCKQDKTVDPTVMPAETTTGANTFGCLVDGWLYVGGRYFNNGTANHWSINFTYTESTNSISVRVKVKDIGKGNEYIAFTIDDPVETDGKSTKNCTFSNARWTDETDGSNPGENLGSGKVEITYFDKTTKIISGRFSSDNGRIKHGQFDVIYK